MTRQEYDAIARLASELGELNGRIDAQEVARKEMRARDDEWRVQTTEKLDDITAQLSEVPCLMDSKIKACRAERTQITAAAVADANQRHVLASVATDWRTWAAAIISTSSVIVAWIR